MTLDPLVHGLAETWLSDDDDVRDATAHDARVMSLAADIQRVIEQWCEDEADYNAQLAEKDDEMRAIRHLSDTEKERI